MNKLPRYAWDTSILLGWLKNEAAYANEIDAILSDVEAGKASLLLSTIVLFEISAARHTPEELATVKKFLRRGSVVVIDVTEQIAWKAGQIRDRVVAASPSAAEMKKVARNDALIIATAVIYEADVLHTAESRWHVLSGTDQVEGLKITVPQLISGQKLLPAAPDSEPPGDSAPNT